MAMLQIWHTNDCHSNSHVLFSHTIVACRYSNFIGEPLHSLSLLIAVPGDVRAVALVVDVATEDISGEKTQHLLLQEVIAMGVGLMKRNMG